MFIIATQVGRFIDLLAIETGYATLTTLTCEIYFTFEMAETNAFSICSVWANKQVDPFFASSDLNLFDDMVFALR